MCFTIYNLELTKPVLRNKTYGLLLIASAFFIIFSSCSNKKNTALTRTYHAINTKYNIHYNADLAYKEALATKEAGRTDNLSELLYIYPDNSDTTKVQSAGGGSGFETAIDKTTKAIRLHSIKARPRRNPNKRNDAGYQAWIKQKEFNPFMKNTWMLLAKSEFQKGDYLRAATTFLYITKIYSTNKEIVTECKLWIARAYTEMGWMYEAANVLHKIEIEGPIPEKLTGFYASVKANHLIRTEAYIQAIPELEVAIKKEKSKRQKMRMRYLLGQLYTQNEDIDKAYEAYAKVQGMSTPYYYSFNAKLNQIELLGRTQKKEAISQLEKMVKPKRNEEYLDQIYSAIGDIYMHDSDSLQAIKYYQKAISESKRNAFDKASAQVKLGDIYFNKREYIPAQPCYSEALGQLKKTNENYPRVALRSEVLDGLVVHVKTVEEQDSLQHLASLPAEERLQIINKKIEDLKLAEARQKQEEELQQRTQERENNISSWADLEKKSMFDLTPESQTQIPPTTNLNFGGQQNSQAVFYFYNKQIVDQGKIAFQKSWGSRKLEDDWRRKNKSVSTFDNFGDIDAVQTDSISHTGSNRDIEDKQISTEKYSPEYYLQQLPLTPEKIEASNALIEDALFNMGKIYKDKLADLNLASDAFRTNLKRFPSTPNKENIYYQLFLIYMQQNDSEMMAFYRNAIISEFPDGIYATPLSEPDYEWNFRHIAIAQDSLYDATFQAYRNGEIATVRDNYKSLQTKYPFIDLMPKFMLLNALTYAQTRDAKELSTNLKELVDKYPKSDVEPLASDILIRIKDGQILLSDGSPIKGLDWSMAYANDSTLFDEQGLLAFSDSLDSEYMLLLRYPKGNIDRNDLLYKIADYNFSNYVVQTFDLDFDTQPTIETLQIKGFKTFANIRSYINKGFGENGLIHQLDSAILIVPISKENYPKLVAPNGLEEYITFFREKIGYQLPNLLAYWDGNKIETTEPEDAELIAENDIEQQITEVEEVQHPAVTKNNDRETSNKEPENKKDNSNEINADELLSKDQREVLEQANDVLNTTEEILNNPVDGLKNLIKGYKDRKKMTKEEKEAEKEQKRIEKQLNKQRKQVEKQLQDSLRTIEKIRLDSVRVAEKAVQDSLDRIEQQKRIEKDRIKEEKKAAEQAKEAQQKQREQERKDKAAEQKERLRQRELERKEKIRLQKERRKNQEEERKKLLKEREEERKRIEKGRKEKEKQ